MELVPGGGDDYLAAYRRPAMHFSKPPQTGRAEENCNDSRLMGAAFDAGRESF
jgi:hypothetical protein